MDDHDIRTLKILERIEEDQYPSQRAIAKKLNISLGLVNSFIKRLVNKGYFKITTIPANRVKYILTPKGAAEKTRLTVEYVRYSLNYYKATRQKLGGKFQELAERGVKRIVFYGFEELAEIAFVALQDFPIDLVAVVDEKKAGDTVWGRPVIAPGELVHYEFDVVFVTIVGLEVDDLAERLSGMGIARQKVMGL